MTAAEEYEAARGQLRRVAAQPSRRMTLVEFVSLPQLREVLRDLREIHPGRGFVEVEYDPPQRTAPKLLQEAAESLARVPSDPIPLLVLRPRELSASAESERAAFEFWQAMNFRRETLAGLNAQTLLCADPWHCRRIADRAGDLWTWLVPKIHLIPPSDAALARQEILPALASFAGFHISPEAADKQWETLWPELELKVSKGQFDSGDFRRYVFPLLESAIATGNLVRARQVAAAAREDKLTAEDMVEWHRLNGMLACGESDFSRAEEHARKLLSLARQQTGKPLRENAAIALNSIANLLSEFGQASAAESLLREAVSVESEVFGADHRNTLLSRNDLALALRQQGRFDEAQNEYESVLALQESTLGEKHPDTLVSLNNLADLLRAKGDYTRAKLLQHRGLAGMVETLGAENRDMLCGLSNLANLLAAEGDYAAAEPLYRRALETMEKTLGAEHPDTLLCMSNLARLLYEKADYVAAEPLCRQALTSAQKTLGAEHPYTLNSLNNLANVLWANGDFTSAEPLYRRALAAREKILGSEHPDVFRSCFGLALDLFPQGKNSEAGNLLKRAYEGFKRKFGEDFPATEHAKKILDRLGLAHAPPQEADTPISR
jgi:tetratricopeptide (TPR) repeat protein